MVYEPCSSLRVISVNSVAVRFEQSSEPNSNSSTSVKIKVSDDRRLSEIQRDFNTRFPYLAIEFFKAPHKIGEGSAKNLLHASTKLVRECRLKHPDGELEIFEGMTVSELEEAFQKLFGLSIQVFRKSGNVWLETSATDGWTLLQQNNEGMELSTQMEEKKENPEDSDIY